ncbi:DsbA family protein [Corticibacter populi]|uniref:DsbA family protein n=1 Tax=Corticibacter populi TaxID=1550736 RepID=A0A3M6QHK9_9BURK|nr:DsbA family protein [Corticibacter populi]RMX02584.1 DsbA family protein [Corticibacter populi]RZS33005.1 putative protein-disulfide isomerase [Corticibacter populi]
MQKQPLKTVHYLFDPLCGWCYGASAALDALARGGDVQLHLMPSGLFAGNGARRMTRDFADYAWDNDQRIQLLTGQPFSETYRRCVLADHLQMFDSGPATMALTAVALTAPEQELAALKAMQRARYVDGRNITEPATLAAVLQGLGLEAAAVLLCTPSAEPLEVNRSRVGQARQLMQAMGARGVPTFVLETGGRCQLLQAGAAFTQPEALVEQVVAT